MSYMKKFLEESLVKIVAISNDSTTIFKANIKASSFKEAEINFFSLMREEKHLEPGDDYTIKRMDIWSE